MVKKLDHNPDHGFIYALYFHDIGRLGCPVCSHDEKHKVKNGCDCETCLGSGSVDYKTGKEFIVSMEYDIELVEIK